MSVRSTLGGVGHSGPPTSVPEAIFREYTRGKATLQEFHVTSASWVAKNLEKYSFRDYPPMSRDLRDYAEGRASGAISERDPANHRRLGTWTHAVRSLWQQNDSDLSLLVWCEKVLGEVAMGTDRDAVRRKIPSLSFPLPPVYETATKAQVIDARDKARAG